MELKRATTEKRFNLHLEDKERLNLSICSQRLVPLWNVLGI